MSGGASAGAEEADGGDGGPDGVAASAEADSAADADVSADGDASAEAVATTCAEARGGVGIRCALGAEFGRASWRQRRRSGLAPGAGGEDEREQGGLDRSGRAHGLAA